MFKAMFPDSQIAARYTMSETKCKYMIQFGIREWVLEELIRDSKDKPFSFKFDETTTVQVKKQYDAYIQFESTSHNKILTRYCGSSFHGHCDANTLKDNFFEFKKRLSLNVNCLLQLMMDGPNVNKSFARKLMKALEDEYSTTLIDAGNCSLHVIHNGCQKGLKMISFDFDGFANDLAFFLKRSSARREDFKSAELVTEIEAHFMVRHVSSRWLSLKKTLNRIIEQWENLKYYFLTFLPKEKNFAKEIETTQRYQNIRSNLSSNRSLLCMKFAIHIADIFEGFLTLLQSSKPVIHVLCNAVGDVFYNLMTNFVNSKVLETSSRHRKDAHALGAVDVDHKDNVLSIHKIDYGKAALHQIAQLEATTKLDSLKTEFKMCYQETMKYLQTKLPHENMFLKDLQYLHKSKRLKPEAVPAIRRIAAKVSTVLQGSKFTELSVDRYANLIVQQFRFYQTEELDFDAQLDSYSFWNKIGEIKTLQGEPQYTELSKLVIACLSLSHGNADPERGFSFNKAVLQNREAMEEDTIIAIRMVKDAIIQYGGAENFPMPRRLLDLCAASRRKYFLHLDIEKENRQHLAKEQEKAKASREHQEREKLTAEKVSKLESELEEELTKLNVAQKLISDGNQTLSNLTIGKGKVDKELVLKSQMVINAGIEKSITINSNIEKLRKTIKDLTTTN